MSTKTQRNILSMALQYQLMNYVKDKYVESGLFDAEFATKAQEELKFPISPGNVKGCRDALGIPANYTARVKPQHYDEEFHFLKGRVDELEQQLAILLRERAQRGVLK